MYHQEHEDFYIDSIRERQTNGDRIVFTNGCFDIIHVGHIELLIEASTLGDVLVVGLNSDESIKKIKGNDRPIINENHRYIILNTILQSIIFFSHVFIFNEETPIKLIEKIKPNVLVKGGDWKKENIVGAQEVNKNGGVVRSIPFKYDISTTKIIEKIKSSK